MSAFTLREYQRECVDAVFTAWGAEMRRPAVILPTGAGKTVVFSAVAERFRQQHPTFRVMVLLHRDELADQAIEKLRATLPEGTSVGKVKAEDNEVGSDVVVCSVQTLNSKRRRDALLAVEAPIGLIITDECHHAVAASYQKVYAAWPYALQLGVTATLERGDGRGLGDTWDDVVYSRSILWMMSKDYLAPVKAVSVGVDALDMTGVKVSGGDYQAGALGQAMLEAHAETVIARAYLDHAKERPGVVFTPTVATAHAAAEELNAVGIRTAVISGETPRDERRQIFEDFRTGAIQVLSNCMVLTEGFDAPHASCAVIARPTRSAPLYTQMVGRVLRPHPGKEDALILHVAGAGAQKLRTLVDLAPDVLRNVRENETLEDAAERAEEEALLPEPPRKAKKFTLSVKEVELFEGSSKTWLRTPAGVYFVPCGDTLVFLWPSDRRADTWDVCHVSPGQKWQRSKYTGLPLPSALMWGETVAEDRQGFSIERSARWRKSAPSSAQADYATRLGVPVTGRTRGDVADGISLYKAANLFDGYAVHMGVS